MVAIIGGGTTLMAVLRESYLFASYSIGLVLGYMAHSLFAFAVTFVGPYVTLYRNLVNWHAEALHRELTDDDPQRTSFPVLVNTERALSLMGRELSSLGRHRGDSRRGPASGPIGLFVWMSSTGSR